MHFAIELIVPPTATQGSPAVGSVTITRGIISQVDIQFASGVNGSVMCQLFLAGQQLYPNVAGSAYRLWTQAISFRDNYPTFPKESRLQLRAWSDGASYSHTINSYINVLPFSGQLRRVTV